MNTPEIDFSKLEDCPVIFNENESSDYEKDGKFYTFRDEQIDSRTMTKKDRAAAKGTSRMRAKFNGLKGNIRRYFFWLKFRLKL